MKLTELFDLLFMGTKVLVRVPIKTASEKTFEIELLRGDRFDSLNPDFMEWLKSLNLEVKHISAIGEDSLGNKEMISIVCEVVEWEMPVVKTVSLLKKINSEIDTTHCCNEHSDVYFDGFIRGKLTAMNIIDNKIKEVQR